MCNNVGLHGQPTQSTYAINLRNQLTAVSHNWFLSKLIRINPSLIKFWFWAFWNLDTLGNQLAKKK